MPAPSEAGKFGHEAGQISLSFGPIYFRLGTVNSCCFGAGSLGTRLHDRAVPGSCPSVLELGWGGSSCSAGFPTAANLCHELRTAEAALWNRQLFLVMTMRACHTSTLQCQEGLWPGMDQVIN